MLNQGDSRRTDNDRAGGRGKEAMIHPSIHPSVSLSSRKETSPVRAGTRGHGS